MEQNPAPLSQILENAFSKFRDRPCILTSQNELLSFENYFALILGFAERLRILGVRPGNLVSVNLRNYEFSLALRLAVLRIGATNAPSVIGKNFEFSDIKINKIISLKEHPTGHSREVFFSPDWLRLPSGYAPIAAGGGFIHATSGSTGAPKLRYDSEAVFLARLGSNKAIRGPFSGPVLNLQNIGTLIGQKAAIGALLEGAMQLSARETDAETLGLISQFEITDMFAPPLILKRLKQQAASGNHGFSSLVRINMGGGAVSNEFARSIEKQFGCELWSDYGSTETDTIASGRMAISPENRTIFTDLYPDVKIEVTDGDEDLIRVWIPPTRQAKAYMDDEALFDDTGWRVMDDLGKITNDNELEIFGRASDVINAGGNKIAPHTIEALVEKLPQIKEVAAFKVPTDTRIDDIGIAVVFHEAAKSEHIENFLKSQIGDLYQIHIHSVDSIPKSEGGKVLRRLLSKKYSVRMDM